MLVSSKNILNSVFPLLMESNLGNCKLIINITTCNDNIILCTLDKVNGIFVQKNILLGEQPFHLGDDVWEIEYGSRIMTFNAHMKNNHELYQLWRDWKLSASN